MIVSRTLARYLATLKYQAIIDHALAQYTVSIYVLSQEHIRIDATGFTGYHQVTDAGLMQFGYTKGGAKDQTQCKLMAASTATGQYLTGDMHPGHLADDPLFRPLLERLFTWYDTSGLLFVGDCKMGALATQALIVTHDHYYYHPLSSASIKDEEWATWIQQALEEQLGNCLPIWREEILLGYGYELAHERQSGSANSEANASS